METNKEINIKDSITATEMASLYNRIIISLYDDNGDYQPQYFEYIWRKCVIEAVTDYELPEDIDEAYVQVYGNVWYQTADYLAGQAVGAQLADVRDAVEIYIKNREAREGATLQFKEMFENMKVVMQAMTSEPAWAEWLADKSEESSEHSPITDPDFFK